VTADAAARGGGHAGQVLTHLGSLAILSYRGVALSARVALVGYQLVVDGVALRSARRGVATEAVHTEALHARIAAGAGLAEAQLAGVVGSAAVVRRARVRRGGASARTGLGRIGARGPRITDRKNWVAGTVGLAEGIHALAVIRATAGLAGAIGQVGGCVRARPGRGLARLALAGAGPITTEAVHAEALRAFSVVAADFAEVQLARVVGGAGIPRGTRNRSGAGVHAGTEDAVGRDRAGRAAVQLALTGPVARPVLGHAVRAAKRARATGLTGGHLGT